MLKDLFFKMQKWNDCHLDSEKCRCHGDGWIVAGPSFDECPIHYEGQLHPDSKSLLFDDPKALEDAKHKSKLKWLLKEKENEILYLEKKIMKSKEEKRSIEKELMQKTTTKMPAIKLNVTL